MPPYTASAGMKVRVRILTVNHAQRIVEGILPDNGKIAISVWEAPSGFRWPKTNEIWSASRIGSQPWSLGCQVTDISTLPPGEIHLDADRITDGQGRKLLVQGDVLAPGTADPSLMHWRGDWLSTTTYKPNDVVYASGSPWVALVANTNSTPTSGNTNWRQLASGGSGIRKYVTPLGAIVAGVPVPINHALGTLDVSLTVFAVSTGEVVFADTTYQDPNTALITFVANHPANSYRVVVIG